MPAYCTCTVEQWDTASNCAGKVWQNTSLFAPAGQKTCRNMFGYEGPSPALINFNNDCSVYSYATANGEYPPDCTTVKNVSTATTGECVNWKADHTTRAFKLVGCKRVQPDTVGCSCWFSQFFDSKCRTKAHAGPRFNWTGCTSWATGWTTPVAGSDCKEMLFWKKSPSCTGTPEVNPTFAGPGDDDDKHGALKGFCHLNPGVGASPYGSFQMANCEPIKP
eukprot:TRINITY_DN52333_c0_g1_i1.p2 TRINITY_DN52333_c0_g1~~TRINITY_DN52333_c0_g1_i1.p2  ORF type:complete len:258 (-),score=10.85 TRINITY_DN52333_c0_g1_i1:122-784(-)